MLLVTVTVTAAAWSPLAIVAGLPEIDGVPNVQPAEAAGSVGSPPSLHVALPICPTVVDPPAARLTVWSPAPQLYTTANVPAKPDVKGSNTLLTFRSEERRVGKVVTVSVTAGAWSPLTIVAGLPEIDGVPNVQPAGAAGRDGSLTVHDGSVLNGSTVVDPPAARLTVWSPAPQLYTTANVPAKPDVKGSNTLLTF